MKPGDRVVFVEDDGPTGEAGTVTVVDYDNIHVRFDNEIDGIFAGRCVWSVYGPALQKINEDEEIADARRDLVTVIARRGAKAGGA